MPVGRAPILAALRGVLVAGATALWAGGVVACSPDPVALTGCEPRGEVEPLCGFRNPEDLARLPGAAWVVVSEMAREELPGHLTGLRAPDDRRRRLFPGGVGGDALDARQPWDGWGDPDCPGPPEAERFAPHGLDVSLGGRSLGKLAVVNHGREAVELFEVAYAEGGPALGWRGCVSLPEGSWANDVAFHPDGGFVVSDMLPPPGGVKALWAGMRIAFGADTGRLWRWQPESGLEPVPDSEASGPNGVAVSPDGSQIFLAEWGAQRVVRLRSDGEPRRAAAPLDFHPDNLSWTRDGRLLVAGQRAPLGEVLACGEVTEGTCGLPYAVVALEPTSLEVEMLVDGSTPEATGAVSAALQVRGDLFLGTFAGDRLVRLPMPRP